MLKRLVGVLVVATILAALTAFTARAERLVGQYRGPLDKLTTIKETDDTSIEAGEKSPAGGGGTEGSAPRGGDSGGGGDTGGGDGTGDPGGEGGGEGGGGDPNPPPSGGGDGTGGDAGGGTGDSGSGDSGSGDGRGDASAGTGGPAPGSGPSGGPGGVSTAPGGGGAKGKTDLSEGFKLWSFYWEHNREWLINELIKSRSSRANFSPWGSSWVLGRGEKTFRQITPVGQGIIAEKVMPLLQNALTHRDDLIRDAVVVAMGKVGGKDVVPLLEGRALKDPDAEVREDATLALGLTREPEAYPTLLKILRGEGIQGGTSNVNQRCFAAFALGLLKHDEAAPEMLLEFRKAVRARADENLLASMALGIGMLGQESSVKELGDFLLNPRINSELVKAYIASALGKVGHRDAIRPLQRAYGKATPRVRGAIALAMGSYAETPVVTFLEKEGLKDGEGQNQNFTAISLARIGAALPPDTVGRKRVLVRLQERATKPQKNSTLAEYAALGLAFLGEDAMVPHFRDVATSTRHKHHVRSIMALSTGILGDRSSIGKLAATLKNRGEDPKLRSYAALALAFLGDSSQVPFLKKQYEKAADRNARDVMRGCVLAIGFLGDATDVDFLIDDVLIEADDPTVRGAAAIALGIMRESTAIEKLIKVVEARQSSVSIEDKAFAVAALGYLADKDPFPYLSTVFENCNYRLEYPQLISLLQIL